MFRLISKIVNLSLYWVTIPNFWWRDVPGSSPGSPRNFPATSLMFSPELPQNFPGTSSVLPGTFPGIVDETCGLNAEMRSQTFGRTFWEFLFSQASRVDHFSGSTAHMNGFGPLENTGRVPTRQLVCLGSEGMATCDCQIGTRTAHIRNVEGNIVMNSALAISLYVHVRLFATPCGLLFCTATEACQLQFRVTFHPIQSM